MCFVLEDFCMMAEYDSDPDIMKDWSLFNFLSKFSLVFINEVEKIENSLCKKVPNNV